MSAAMARIVTGAKFIPGMEVGGDYTYLTEQHDGSYQAARCVVISIDSDGGCTVSVIETWLADPEELAANLQLVAENRASLLN